MSNKIFRIEIIQPKFDELYRQYEGSFNRADIQKQNSLARKNQAVIKPKTLELMAKELGNLYTGTELIDFLTECGVDRNAIEYPQTKWRMVYDVFLKLATSDKNEDKTTLFKIIGEAVHPLMHNGDTASAESLLNKFNDLLSYENGHISFDEEENAYKVSFVPSKKEQAEIMAEFHEELAEEEKKQQEFLCQPENKEKISQLRKTYQALMGVVEVFCRNFSRLSHEDIVELNKHYLALDKVVWGLIDELKLGGSFDAYKKYPRPFSNLFSAEKELGGDIKWDVIRREMSARFGEIETLYQQVNASEILAEPDKQKQLNDVILYLSELKEKTKETQEKQVKPITPIPFEITIKNSSSSGVTENALKPKVKLNSTEVKYDDDNATLHIGTQKCQIPPYKNEHYLCRAMYEYNANEPADWSEVYEKITGYYEAYYGKPPATRQNWRIVYDAMDALNKRIKETINTDDDLFTWQEKTIKRNLSS